MAAVVRLEWQRDSKGYDIVEGPDPERTSERAGSKYEGTLGDDVSSNGIWIVPRGGDPQIDVLEGVENRVFEDVANTERTPEGALALINKRGMLTRMRVPGVSNVYSCIDDIRAVLKLIELGDLSRLERATEKRGVGPLHVRFGRVLGDSTPRVFVEPKSLFQFCWLELMQVVAGQVKIQSCLHCGAYFSIGLKPGVRRTRLYCSSRCKSALNNLQRRGPPKKSTIRPKSKL